MKYTAIILNKDLSIENFDGTTPGMPRRTLFVEFSDWNAGLVNNQSTMDYFKEFNTDEDILKIAIKYYQDYCGEALENIGYTREVCKNVNFTYPNELKPGQVVNFIDTDYHLGLLLRVGAKKSYMLMVTSSAIWNDRSRRITQDEFNLLGMPQRKISYFAPVSRSNDDLTPTQITFPTHRLLDLIKEFK